VTALTKSTRILVLFTTIALALRLALALGSPNDEPDDAQVYARLAHNVLEHGTYSIEEEAPFTPTYVRVPGYPLFLAGVYAIFGDGNNTAVRVVQAAADTLTCWLVALIAVRWSGSRPGTPEHDRVLIVGLGVAALCPFTAIYVTTLLTETVAMCLGMLLLLVTTTAVTGPADDRRRRRWWAAAGLVGGIMTLVRPESGLWVAAAGLTLLATEWRRARVRVPATTTSALKRWLQHAVPAAMALSLGFAAALAPWTIRNAIVFGRFEPLNPRSLSMPGEFVADGYPAWLRSWIDHPRYVWPLLFNLDRDPITVDQVPARAFDSPDERAHVAQLFERYSTPLPGTPPDETGHVPPGGMTPEIDAEFATIAAARAARHPFREYVRLPVQRALMLWFDPHADYYPFAGFLFPLQALDRDRQQQIWLPLFLLLTWLWTIAGWIGAYRLWREPDTRVWLVLVALLILPRLALLASMENPEPRYTVEFFPLIAVLMACATAWRSSPPMMPDARRTP
jgi:Dolichyl-phosphate-mannose-protein mannosyltransferase